MLRQLSLSGRLSKLDSGALQKPKPIIILDNTLVLFSESNFLKVDKYEGIVRPEEQWKPVRSLEDAIANPVEGQDTSVQAAKVLLTQP